MANDSAKPPTQPQQKMKSETKAMSKEPSKAKEDAAKEHLAKEKEMEKPAVPAKRPVRTLFDCSPTL